VTRGTSSPDPTRNQPSTPVAELEGRVIGRHKALLSDPTVRSWWEARSLRSRLSADQYLRQLGLLLEHLGLSSTEIGALAKNDPDRLRDMLIRNAATLKGEGKLDSYVSKFSEGLKSYFRFQRIPFDGYPLLSSVRGASLGDERVPSPEELGRILDHLSPRGRVIALFMAHSGVRPGVLGAYQGGNGLRLSDLTELVLDRKKRSFAKVPFVIRVPADLSKTRVAYVTFGTSQLAQTFLGYLNDRALGGETLKPDSPVVAGNPVRGVALLSRQGARYSKGFLSTKVIVEEVRSALQATVSRGVRWRPYVLRAYCSTRLLMAEGAGKITWDLREAILGHDGGVAARYNVGKRWSEELLNEARAAFRRCEPFLSTATIASGSGDGADRVLKAFFEARGLPSQEAAKLDFSSKSNEELVEMFRKLGSAQAPSTSPTERAVATKEVPGLLEQGWRFVAALDAERTILRSP
jgi:integrase